MTIKCDPASIDFGDVLVGNEVAHVVTITNDLDFDYDLTPPVAPYSMVPSSVKVKKRTVDNAGNIVPTSVQIKVRFLPKEVGSVLGSIASVGGGPLCQLSGTGVLAGADTEETLTVKKALFIHVPDFSDGQFEQHGAADAVETTMTSFLRLGTFDYKTESGKARELLKVIHQAGPPGDPIRGAQRMIPNPASNDPAEVPKWDWDAENGEFPDAPPFQARADAAEAKSAGSRDVFFLDDVRIRDVDVAERDSTALPDESIKGHGLTMEQRQAESARLYSRGGWRDHSDGNRITTTYGDKVEVIRGNYKMIILGRQDNPGEAMGWDVGGSHVTDYAPGTMPGATFWHEWIPDYQFTDSSGVERKGVWLLVNTTENVYQYARNAGNFREEQWGNVVESYVGSENPPEAPGDPPTPLAVATDETSGSQGHEPPYRFPDLQYNLPGKSDAEWATPPFKADNTDIIRSNPHLIEKTWARRIDSWTGSEARPVPEIHEKTFADKIFGDTGSATRRVQEIHETQWAVDTYETVDVANRVEGNTRAGSIFEATTAGTIFEATTAALHSELHTGAHISIEAGLVFDMFAGGKVEVVLAAHTEFDLQEHLEVKPVKQTISIKDLNLAMREYVLAVTSTSNYLNDERAALSTAMTALKVEIGI